MTVNRTFGLNIDNKVSEVSDKKIIQYINLKLAADGYPICTSGPKTDLLEIAKPLLDSYNIKSRLLSKKTFPMGKRIQDFLTNYLSDVSGDNSFTFPEHPFILDRYGLGRMVSMPPNTDYYETDIIKSYRTAQGILNNPKEDRRTTKGVFHVAEGGLPIPDDKKAVPKSVFCKLLQKALDPPKDLMVFPFTANQEQKAELFVSLMLRPIVVPDVPGVIREKSMEIYFLAPGSLVSNLDFVESIFGNAGDPFLPENDAALLPANWTGHTGCIILAPHLTRYTKKELGLPHFDNATERQHRDGMCWKTEDEKYNDGGAFKITARDKRGIAITLIADNYYGYSKKEVKTMISYSANLFGLAEEEHAGGAIAFRTNNLGEKFYLDVKLDSNRLNFADFTYLYADMIELRREGYAIDKKHPQVIYVPEDSLFDLLKQTISWKKGGEEKSIKLLPYKYYIYPNGYKVEMRKRIEGPRWHLVGTLAEGTLCHKPCTVSGGGKSEISKSIKDAMIQSPVIVSDLAEDFDMVEKIMSKDFSSRFKVPADYSVNKSRPILSPKRSLGSVIKLLTPAEEYTEEYNKWLTSFPHRIKVLIYVIKGNFNQDWDEHWRKYFSVDKINGLPGNMLKFQRNKLYSNFLRVGHDTDGSWRIFQLRQDYNPSSKVQVEDDITASVIIDSNALENLNAQYKNSSVKLVKNCEARLFQRPDDCVHKGYDKQGEKDLSSPNTFLSNFEPLTREQVQEIKDDTIGFELYTQPVKDLINNFLNSASPKFLVVPSQARLVNGVPSQNPRYLQVRPDVIDPVSKYVAEVGTRIFRKIPLNKPVFMPVNAVLPGRRNNPADIAAHVPPLAVYNPIHYQELPELFIDFICSITGKSPSTTGFGSEGALTKGPFNSLLPATDLNNSFLSYILTGYHGFSSAAGYIGPKIKVDHDVSLLIPELWCRMSVEEREPKYLIENGYLEKVENVNFKGTVIDCSMLGYRITLKFVTHFMARIFSNPEAVFSEEMLHPELQDIDAFAKSIETLSITQKHVAEGLMRDGTVDMLCPPLKALVHIMAEGHYKDMNRNHPGFREMFTREKVLNSAWYNERLIEKQKRDINQWTCNVAYFEEIIGQKNSADTSARLNLPERLKEAKEKLKVVSSPKYLDGLKGTIGADTLRPIEDL